MYPPRRLSKKRRSKNSWRLLRSTARRYYRPPNLNSSSSVVGRGPTAPALSMPSELPRKPLPETVWKVAQGPLESGFRYYNSTRTGLLCPVSAVRMAIGRVVRGFPDSLSTRFVNKGKSEGRSCWKPRPSWVAAGSYSLEGGWVVRGLGGPPRVLVLLGVALTVPVAVSP